MPCLFLACHKLYRSVAKSAVVAVLAFFVSVPSQIPGQSSPADTQPITRARELLRQGKNSAAETALRVALVQDAGQVQAHSLLAFALFGEHKPKESLAEFTIASRIASPSPEDLRCVALDYVLLDDYAEADKWLTQSIALDSKNPETWYALGRVRYTEARYESARDCFLQVLSLSPRDARAEDNLGLAYEELHQLDDAITAFRKAIGWQQSAQHRSEQPMLNLAELLVDRNQLDEAIPLLNESASISPANSEVHKQLGIIYLRKQKPDLARAQFEKAVAADPGNASLHFLLGRACLRAGDAAQARMQFARAAELAKQQAAAPHE